MSSRHNIEEDARSFGFHKASDPKTHHISWQIACKKCKKTEEHGWGPTTSPDLMVRNMRLRGWDITTKGTPKCPDCRKSVSKKERAAQLETLEAMLREQDKILAASAPPAVAAVPILEVVAAKANAETAIALALKKAVEAKTSKPTEGRGVFLSVGEFAQINGICEEMIHRLTKYQEVLTRLSSRSKALG